MSPQRTLVYRIMDRFRGFKSYFLRQNETRPMPSGVFHFREKDLNR